MYASLVTGGFDPLHVGHLDYLNSAATLGDRLIVGLNSDDWLIRKKGAAFMPRKDRANIIRALRVVDTVMFFNDSDDTACHAIERALRMWSGAHLIFANGGDRGIDNTPEIEKFGEHPRVSFAFGVGGDKAASSSKLLARWVKATTLPKQE
jgi:D-beta-D-heptose 7-phosphate kinase/D-beta-D-heptose 1-phosphate adenosyltransferase